MTVVFGLVVLLIIVVMVHRKWNNSYHEELFRHKMFALRDELRKLAIEEKIYCHTMVFDYVDFSISKTIEQSYFITLFYILSLEKKHNNLDQYEEVFENIFKEIRNNHHLNMIFIKKNKIMKEYIIGQNQLSFFIISKVVSFISNIYKIKKYIKNILSETNYLPELSGINKINPV